MKNKIIACFSILLILASVFGAAIFLIGAVSAAVLPYYYMGVATEPKIIEVDDDFIDDPPNHKWDTIQEGINDANDEDTVLVYNGTYYENVIVNKSISLIGADRNTTIINGGVNGDVVRVTVNNAKINGFTIRNSNDSGSGIKLNSSINNTIQNVTVIDNYYSILLYFSNDNILCNNNVSNNWHGIKLDHSR